MNNNSIRDNNRLAKVAFFLYNNKLFHTLFQQIALFLTFKTLLLLFSPSFLGQEKSIIALYIKKENPIFEFSFDLSIVLIFMQLEFCTIRSSRERNYVTNICHARNKKKQSFKTQTKACMWASSIFPGF